MTTFSSQQTLTAIQDAIQKPMFKAARGLKFVMELKPSNDRHYVGKGVKLNTPDTPVFWYRPDNSETYRVIYADLTVKELPADQLPQDQP